MHVDNALTPMDVIESGIRIDGRLVQPLKA